MAFHVSYSSPRITQLYAWENSNVYPVLETRSKVRLPTTDFAYSGVDIVHQFEWDPSPRRYEAWSPNCPIIPSYHGVPPSLHDLEEAAAVGKFPLFDGSLGCFDYRFFPQVLDDKNVELSFVTKERRNGIEWAFLGDLCERTSAGEFQLTRRALTSLVDRAKDLEWKRNNLLQTFASERLRDRIRSDWTESPTEHELMARLGLPLPWENLVLCFAAVQRKLVQKEAFSKLHDAIVRYNLSTGKEGVLGVRPAETDFLGCWASGLSQQSLNLLLECGVPVFFLHEYVPGVDFPLSQETSGNIMDRRQIRERKGFHFEGERPFLDGNKYDELARLSHCDVLATYSLNLPCRPFSQFGTPCSSWHHGYRRLKVDARTPSLPNPSNCDKGEFRPSSTVHRVLVDDNVRPRPTPPPIQKAPYGHLWSRLKEKGFHPNASPRALIFESVGYRYRPPYYSVLEVWYDRENCRMFYLFNSRLNDIDHIEPDGTDEFGRPWPDLVSLPKGVGRPTKWVYSTKDPRSLKRSESTMGSFRLSRGDSSDLSGVFGVHRHDGRYDAIGTDLFQWHTDSSRITQKLIGMSPKTTWGASDVLGLGSCSSSSSGEGMEQPSDCEEVGPQRLVEEYPSVVNPHGSNAIPGSNPTCTRNTVPLSGRAVSNSTCGINVFGLPSPDENLMHLDDNVDDVLTTPSSTQAACSPAQEIGRLDFRNLLNDIPKDVDDCLRIKTARRMARTTNRISVPTPVQMARLSEGARVYAERGLFVAKKNKRQKMGRREREARQAAKERYEAEYMGVRTS